MKRWLSRAALAALIVATLPSIANAANDAARCASLADQWKAAKIAKAASPGMARAKVWARSAEHDCAKDSDTHREDGVKEYLEALRILGVAAK